MSTSYDRRQLAGKVINLWDDAVDAKKMADRMHSSENYADYLQRYYNTWEAYQKANTELFLFDVDN